eukprot:14798984-Ditylum_brightwellii.AAC.1
MGVNTKKQLRKKGKNRNWDEKMRVSSSTVCSRGSSKEEEIPMKLAIVDKRHYNHHDQRYCYYDQKDADYQLRTENESVVSPVMHELAKCQAVRQRQHQKLAVADEEKDKTNP